MSLALLRAVLITDPIILLLTALMGTVSLGASALDGSGRASHRIARFWSRALLFVSGVKVELEGLEGLDPNTGYVFASNHLSLMDTPVAIANIPAQFRFLAKRSLFKVPFIGGHLNRAGHIPVERDDPRAAVKVMALAARLIQERGISILVFPEGGRSEDGALQDFKEGAAYIAIKAAAPIVPMAVSGTRGVLAMGSITIRGGRVRVRLGAPVDTSGLKLADRVALTAKVREEIAGLLAKH
jgi:1-acyl-sn-glycerol-3-phosphate acyltransferase